MNILKEKETRAAFNIYNLNEATNEAYKIEHGCEFKKHWQLYCYEINQII